MPEIIIDTDGEDVILESAIDNTNSAGMLIEKILRNLRQSSETILYRRLGEVSH